MRDTIVEEVRQAREAYARRFNFDLDAMCADLRRKQQLSGAQIVSFPKRAARVSTPKKAPQTDGISRGAASP